MECIQCSICQDNIKSPVGVTNSCSHAFCCLCLKQWAQIRMTCPLDRRPFDTIFISDGVGGMVTGKVRLIYLSIAANSLSLFLLLLNANDSFFLWICELTKQICKISYSCSMKSYIIIRPDVQEFWAFIRC